MRIYILCFGRSEFTNATVRSLRRHASPHLSEINIINNGWNEKLVPKKILELWSSTIDQLKVDDIINDVINIENATPANALTSLSSHIKESDPSDYYFVCDNDCVTTTANWDQILLQTAKENPALPKIGADFNRFVCWNEISLFKNEMPFFSQLPRLEIDRVIASPSLSYFDVTKKKVEYPTGDKRITNALTDTTLSIVRGDTRITQQNNRVSYSTNIINLLHIGYIEPQFLGSSLESSMEMIHYHRIRYQVLIEFANDYKRRLDLYLKFLKIENDNIINKYNELFC